MFRTTYTKAVPEGAELFTRKGQSFARCKYARRKTRTAKVTIGQDGVGEEDLLVHDETAREPTLAYLLSRLT